MRVYLTYARLCHALVLVVTAGAAAILASLTLRWMIRGGLDALYFVLLLVCFGFLLFVRATVLRLRREGRLIGEVHTPRDHSLLRAATFFGTLGHLIAVTVAIPVYEGVFVHPERGFEGGAAIFFAALCAPCYLAALWLVESAMDRSRPDTGLATALPGNTRDSSAADDTRK